MCFYICLSILSFVFAPCRTCGWVVGWGMGWGWVISASSNEYTRRDDPKQSWCSYTTNPLCATVDNAVWNVQRTGGKPGRPQGSSCCDGSLLQLRKKRCFVIKLVFMIASCALKHAILASAMDVDCRQVVESPAPVVVLNVTA